MLTSNQMQNGSLHHRKQTKVSSSLSSPLIEKDNPFLSSSSSSSSSESEEFPSTSVPPLLPRLPLHLSLSSNSHPHSSSSSSHTSFYPPFSFSSSSSSFTTSDATSSLNPSTALLSPASSSSSSSITHSAPTSHLNPTPPLLMQNKQKWQNWRIRTFWTLIMVFVFLCLILSAQAWVILIVVAVQLAVFKEVIQIAHVPSKEKKLPWFRLITWYFLVTTNYFFYGESLLLYFAHLIPPWLQPMASHHRLISFSLYCIGLVFFVLNLKKGYYKFQFSQFAWTHMALLLIVVQSHAVINNILEGLFWFFVPCSLVIVNDVFAYICGFFWGKTPLIKLSPKKTWEGFIGGAICTLIFGFVSSAILLHIPYFVCPPTDLRNGIWSSVSCKPNPVFIPQPYTLPSSIPFVGGHTFTFAPVQFHVMMLSLFASSMAPFGGFFASGVKRAFKIKDFGDLIPGHGGITDRFDCQFVMGTFSFLYISSIIGNMNVGIVMQRIMELSIEDQWIIYERLSTLLNVTHQGSVQA